MKISIDDKELFKLSSIQEKVIKNDINEDNFQEDMSRRLQNSLMHKYEKCFERLRNEWVPKLVKRGIKNIPTDKDDFAALIFSQSDYKSRKDRDKEASLLMLKGL